jgi:dGTPase
MYYHHTVVRMSRRADRILTEVFSSYIAEPRQLPNEYRVWLEEQPVHRVVTDYIASLTDRSAQQEYRRLFDSLTAL